MRSVYFLILLLLALSLVVDVDAGWKFWKNKKDKDGAEDKSAESELISSSTTSTTTTTTTTTTTVAPTTASSSSGWKFWKKKKDDESTTASPRTTSTRTTPTPKRGSATPANANRGIAAAADPALAVGVGSVGDKIKEDARNQPRRPNPGTEVGLDFPNQPKPARPGFGSAGIGQGNRDWPDDLSIFSEPGRQSPKLPSQGPTGSINGNRPASVPGTPVSHQSTPAPGARPASVPGSPAGQPASSTQPTPLGPKPTSPTPVASPTKPTAAPATLPTRPTLAPVALPTRPTQAPAALPTRPTLAPAATKPTVPAASPTGSRTWAQIAGGSNKPGSPTPAARPGLATPGKPGQQPVDLTAQGNKAAAQPTQRPGGAAVAAGVAGGAALAGAAAAGAAATTTYSSNPTFSKGKGVTDEDLEKLSEALFIKDTNNAYKYIKVNLQKQISSGSTKDEAPEPLLDVQPEALQIPTIQRVLAIHDNYKLDTRTNEYISPAQRQEESQLVDTFLSTNVMSTAMRFLADKGFLKKDYYEYKDALRTLWFNLYSRGDGKIGSTGFEHVFLSELKLGTEVSGLHNWIYFNAEEAKKRAEYLGYVKKLDLGNKAMIIKMPIKFNNIDRPVTSMFIGTSPELEMALYSVCFYARPEAACPVSLGGAKFNIITHKFRYRGREHIGTAFPEI